MNKNSPKISIGLPVFNGEKYLADALDSLLAQSFSDFELIICDNASSDATAGICEKYAKTDSRIRYFRNKKNVGAAPNFNHTFHVAAGEYFKWAAHDDLCAPEFLARCIETLDADPSAGLAYPRAFIIDELGQKIEPYNLKLPTDSDSAAVRFEALLRGHKCFEVFGLIRSNMLAKTPLIGAYPHGDGVLLARLALLGKFVEVPEYFFFPRRHQEQSMIMVRDYRKYATWFNPKLRNRILFPYWRIHFEFLRSIWCAQLPKHERIRCCRHLIRCVRKKRRLFREDLDFQLQRLRQTLTNGVSEA